jgi:membrane fusion protein (multidrug efflux system)
LETTPAARRSGSPIKVAVALVLLLLVAIAVYAAYMHFRDRVSSDDANVDGHISAIAPKISGNVIEVAVIDNQTVKAGEVLVRIDPRDYQAAVDIAKAAVSQAEGQLRAARVTVPWINDTTESGNTVASAQLADSQTEVERARIAYDQANSSDLAYAQANVASKQASSDRAQADLARMKPLVDKAEISQLQYDSYVAAAKVADSDLHAAQEKLASAQKDAAIRKAALDSALSHVNTAKAQVETTVANRKQVDVRTADAGTAAAAVEAARARLEAAELMLGYTTITAPIDGTVTRKSVEVGQIVQPGQGLMTLIPLQDTWVTANFKETQLADVKPGQRA